MFSGKLGKNNQKTQKSKKIEMLNSIWNQMVLNNKNKFDKQIEKNLIISYKKKPFKETLKIGPLVAKIQPQNQKETQFSNANNSATIDPFSMTIFF